MRSTAAPVIGAIAVLLTVLHAFGVACTISESISLSSQLFNNSTSPDPSQLAAIIGETIIALVCRGLFAVVPAGLLYIALTVLNLRSHWFYAATRIASFYFLLLLPFGSLYGSVLLVALRRRHAEFAPGGSL